jgi:hemerythrin
MDICKRQCGVASGSYVNEYNFIVFLKNKGEAAAMTAIAWKDFYSVGDPSLDAQHQQMIGVINELYEAMEKKSTQQVIKPILDRLVKYTFEHFKREEEEMEAVEYPDLISHKALHDKIRQKTLDLRDNADFVTGQNLLAFLKEWWVGHIQTEDKKYAPYLEALGSHR